MNPDFFLCDVCRAPVPHKNRLTVAVDRTYDGVENVTECEQVDLCHDHAIAALAAMMKKGPERRQDHELGKQLVSIVGSMKK